MANLLLDNPLVSPVTRGYPESPLISRQVVLNLISNTTTKKGLRIYAKLDENIYEKGIKISDKQLAKVNLEKDEFHGN